MDDLITENNSPAIWWTVSIQWGNPYTSPPNGWPRTIWAACCKQPSEIDPDKTYRQINKPPGYSVFFTYWQWTRTMPPERLLKMRASKIANKITKKTQGMFPFAAEIIAKNERAKKPDDYLDLETIRKTQQYRAEYQREFHTEKANHLAMELMQVGEHPDLIEEMEIP